MKRPHVWRDWFLPGLLAGFFWGVLVGSTLATPRPAAQVTPSGGISQSPAETEPVLRTGAPSVPEVLDSGDGQPDPVPSGAVINTRSGPSGAPPTGMIDAGGASYFKPTPRVVVSKGTGGWATWWFSFGHGLYSALRPDLGTKGDLAIVCGGTPYHCLSLPVITTCACLGPGSDRLIDLSRDAFESFAPASRGTTHITLQVIEGGAP